MNELVTWICAGFTPPKQTNNVYMYIWKDSLRGSSVKIGTIQRRLAWPLRKDDTHESRSVNLKCIYVYMEAGSRIGVSRRCRLRDSRSTDP